MLVGEGWVPISGKKCGGLIEGSQTRRSRWISALLLVVEEGLAKPDFVDGRQHTTEDGNGVAGGSLVVVVSEDEDDDQGA